MWLGMFRLRSGMATLQSKALPLGMRDSKRLWRIGWLLASLIIFILTAFILLKGTLPSLNLKYDLSQLTSSQCWLWGHRIHENHYSIQWPNENKLSNFSPSHKQLAHLHMTPEPQTRRWGRLLCVGHQCTPGNWGLHVVNKELRLHVFESQRKEMKWSK